MLLVSRRLSDDDNDGVEDMLVSRDILSLSLLINIFIQSKTSSSDTFSFLIDIFHLYQFLDCFDILHTLLMNQLCVSECFELFEKMQSDQLNSR